MTHIYLLYNTGRHNFDNGDDVNNKKIITLAYKICTGQNEHDLKKSKTKSKKSKTKSKKSKTKSKKSKTKSKKSKTKSKKSKTKSKKSKT